MEASDKLLFEITDLVIKGCDNALSNDEFTRLQHLLKTDPIAAEYYYEVVLTFANMDVIKELAVDTNEPDFDNLFKEMAKQERTAEAIEIPKKRSQRELIQKVVYPPREKRTIPKFSIFTLITSAAAILLIAAFLYFVPPQSRPVASITGNYSAVWRNSENIIGSRLWSDGSVYHLQRGIAEVTFDSGAVVLVESPADIELFDENEMYIRGRITATVPESAYGFTVNTINSKIVDLGTEFGVKSSIDKGTEVHVRKGKVEHVVPIANQSKPSGNLVEAGQASRVSDKGVFYREPFKSDSFRWDRPASYEAAVYGTMPVAYYRFEKGLPRLGFDEMSRTDSVSELAGAVEFVHGPTVDPERRNQALRLSGEHRSGVFIADKAAQPTKGSSLSISLWLRPEKAVEGNQNVIILADSHSTARTLFRFTNQIYVTKDKRVGFYFFNEAGDGRDSYIQLETQNSIPLHQWSHVTATYSDHEVRLFINGQLHASRSGDFRAEYLERGFWGIGCRSGGAGEKLTELAPVASEFQGSIDELCFHDRMMTGEEVQKIYEAAKMEKQKSQ